MSPSIVPPRPRVFSLDPIHPDVLEEAHATFNLTVVGEPGFEKWHEEAEGIIVRSAKITSDDVRRLQKCRHVAKHGVGVDAIASKALKARGITLTNTPGLNSSAVAELAFTLAMTVARQINLIDRGIRAGHVITKAGGGTTGQTLSGKTIGLVGGGNIAWRVAKMFYGALGCEIIMYDPFISPAMLALWEEAIPSSHFVRAHDLATDLLPHADVVSIHVPLLPATTDLIAEKEMRLMKKTAILVNTARGGIVNEPALTRALSEGWIFGAGLDATVVEPPTREAYDELLQNERVILTPHIGAAASCTVADTARSVLTHLQAAFDGNVYDEIY